MHTTWYFALENTLLARLYLKVKVYITNLLSVYNLQKISCLKWNNFAWIFIFSSNFLNLKSYFSEQLNELFLCFCFLDELLKLHLFTRSLYFYHYWWWERVKNQFFKYFWCILPKFEENILEIHKHSWLSITWIKDVQNKNDWHLFPSLCCMLGVIATLLPWSS